MIRPRDADEVFWLDVLVALRHLATAARRLPVTNPMRGPALSAIGLLAKAIRTHHVAGGIRDIDKPPPGP